MIPSFLKSGQRIKAIPSASWNYAQARSLDTGVEQPDETPLLPHGSRLLIPVINGSSNDLDIGQVVGIAEPYITPEDDASIPIGHESVTGVTPSDSHARRFAVLVQPLETDELGSAAIAGIVWARVYVNNASHEYARIEDGSHDLTSTDDSSQYPILYKPSGTGLKDALILLASSAAGEKVHWARGQLGATLSTSSATVSVTWKSTLLGSPPSGVSNGTSVTARNIEDTNPTGTYLLSGNSGATCRMFYNADTEEWHLDDVECDASVVPTLAATAPLNVSGTLSSPGGATVGHDNSGVTAGNYGASGVSAAAVTVDVTGHVTAASSISIVPPTRGIVAVHPIVGGGALSANVPVGHETSGVTPNTYGDATKIPQITVDEWGHVTALTEVDIGSDPAAVTHFARVMFLADFGEADATVSCRYISGIVGTTPGAAAGDTISVQNPLRVAGGTKRIWRGKQWGYGVVLYDGSAWQIAYPREEYRLYGGGYFAEMDATIGSGLYPNSFVDWNGAKIWESVSGAVRTAGGLTGFSSNGTRLVQLNDAIDGSATSVFTCGVQLYIDGTQTSARTSVFSFGQDSTAVGLYYDTAVSGGSLIVKNGHASHTVALARDTWHDIVFRGNGSANASLFVNGNLIATGATNSFAQDAWAICDPGQIVGGVAIPGILGVVRRAFMVPRAWTDAEVKYRNFNGQIQTPEKTGGDAAKGYYGNAAKVPITFVDDCGTVHVEREISIDGAQFVGPTGTWEAVASPTSSSVSSLKITFSRPTRGVTIGQFALTRDGGANLLTSETITAANDNTEYTISGLSGLTTTAGAYVMTFTPAGAKDYLNAPATVTATRSWTKIAGWSLISSNFQFGYPFNDGIAGAPAITRGWDSSGVLASSTDLTIAGTTALATVGGRRCALFSSTSKSLYKSTVPGSWSANTDFTIAFWMQKTTSTDNVQFYPISFNDYSSGTSEGVWLTPTVSSADITIDYNSGTFYPWLRSSTTPAVSTPNDTNWRHWVFVRSAGGATHKYYRDGVLLGTYSSGTYNYGTLSGPLLIGGWTGSSAYTSATRGGIASLLVWSRALSDSDVTTLYNSGSTLQPTT